MSRPAGNFGEVEPARPLLLVWLAGATVWLFYGAFLGAASRESGLGRVEEALFDPQATTPTLAMGLFLYLLHRRRVALYASLGSGASTRSAGLLIGLGAVLLTWAQTIDAPELARLAFVSFVAGGGFWLGGGRLARGLALPLLAIVLSVSLPNAVTNQILLPLQVWTAKFASLLLTLLGQEHQLMGDRIYRGGMIFHVIEGCSGYRGIFSLWLATILYADLACQSTRERAVLLAAVPFVGFVLNGLRVLVLILREVSSETSEHAIQGLLMIVLGVGAVAALEIKLWPILFARSRAKRHGPFRVDPNVRREAVETNSSMSLNHRLIALAALLTILGVGAALWPKPFATSPPQGRLNPEEIGTDLDGWSIKALRREPNLLGSTRFRHVTRRAFTKGEDHYTTFVGVEDRGTRGSSGWSPKTAIPAAGWLAIEPLSATMVGDQPVARSLVRYPGRNVLVYHWREGYRGWLEEALRDWLGLDVSTWRIAHSSVVLRLEANVESRSGAFAEQDEALRALATELHEDVERRLERERVRIEAKQNTG